MKQSVLQKLKSKWRKTHTTDAAVQQSAASSHQPPAPIWYKPDFTRKEADEFLHDKLIGVFVLRPSETIQDCFVLSVKVPKYMNKSEVNHYLVVPASSSGSGSYKIKGSAKEFADVPSLITHCSVIRGELPILLNSDFYLDESAKLERKRSDFFYYSSSTSSLASTVSSELSASEDACSLFSTHHKPDENNNNLKSS